MKYLLPVLILCLTTTACSPVTFLAGASTGVVAYDRRGFSTRVQDYQLAQAVTKQLASQTKINEQSDINVDVYNRIALLTGEVPNQATKHLALKQTRATPGFRAIYNQINIAPPISAAQKAHDTWLATKIKSILLFKNGLIPATQIKVIPVNGTVYLMGQVSHSEAYYAAQTVHQIRGVKKVVKVFEYNY